jgi:hypothetical protein
MPGAIYMDDVTQAEATAYLSENDFEGEPAEDDLARAKKAIVDKNIPLHLSLFHTCSTSPTSFFSLVLHPIWVDLWKDWLTQDA